MDTNNPQIITKLPTHLARPKAMGTVEPYDIIKSYDSNMKIFLELEYTITADEENKTVLHRPGSKSAASVYVFKDTDDRQGVFHMLTTSEENLPPRFHPDKPDKPMGYTTIHLIEQVLEMEPMQWGQANGVLPRNGSAQQTEPRKWGNSLKITERKTMPQLMDELRGVPDEVPLFANFIVKKAITILFAEAGTGKSAMALQIARAISSDLDLPPFGKPTEPCGVIFFNYEQTQLGMLKRYRSDGDELTFSDTFQILCKDTMGQLFSTDNVAEEIVKAKADDPTLGVVFIDNISYLIAYSKELGDVATFLQAMDEIATELDLAIVLINHTTKGTWDKRMSQDDQQGSKAYSNYTDYSLQMKVGKQSSEVMLKEMKTRNEAKIYVGDNTPLFRLTKEPFLELNFLKFTTEDAEKSGGASLRSVQSSVNSDNAKRMVTLGLKQIDIAKYLGVTPKTVSTWINNNLSKPV